MSISTPATRCMDEILNRNRLLYEWVAADGLSKRLRKMSGEAFAIGDDKEARMLRAWAVDEGENARKLRSSYDVGKDEESSWDDLAKTIVERGGWGEESEWPEDEDEKEGGS